MLSLATVRLVSNGLQNTRSLRKRSLMMLYFLDKKIYENNMNRSTSFLTTRFHLQISPVSLIMEATIALQSLSLQPLSMIM